MAALTDNWRRSPDVGFVPPCQIDHVFNIYENRVASYLVEADCNPVLVDFVFYPLRVLPKTPDGSRAHPDRSRQLR